MKSGQLKKEGEEKKRKDKKKKVSSVVNWRVTANGEEIGRAHV